MAGAENACDDGARETYFADTFQDAGVLVIDVDADIEGAFGILAYNVNRNEFPHRFAVWYPQRYERQEAARVRGELIDHGATLIRREKGDQPVREAWAAHKKGLDELWKRVQRLEDELRGGNHFRP